MEFHSEQVLVTGAGGWLGTALMHALVNGISESQTLSTPPAGLRIRAMVLPGPDGPRLQSLSSRIECIVGDLRNPDDCARLCDGARGAVLFHTAGIIHPRRVREFYEVNWKGTQNLLDAAIANGVKRAVVVSSNSPCGTNPHPDHLFDEESPYRPYMNYGRSKMWMELAVHERAGLLETVLLRAPWFYGPYQPPRQTTFFEMIRKGKVPIVGGGGNLRSMAYVDNLVQGMALAAGSAKAAGQTYWIADERPYTMNEIVDTVERLLETEFGQRCAHRRLRLPGMISEVAWLADKTLQGLGWYWQKIHVLSEMNKTIACSVDKARQELGYHPTVRLEEGMRRSLAWVYRKSADAGIPPT